MTAGPPRRSGQLRPARSACGARANPDLAPVQPRAVTSPPGAGGPGPTAAPERAPATRQVPSSHPQPLSAPSRDALHRGGRNPCCRRDNADSPRDRRARTGITDHQLADPGAERCRNIRADRPQRERGGSIDVTRQLREIAALERIVRSQKRVCRHADAPQVTRGAGSLPAHLLGRHESRGAEQRARGRDQRRLGAARQAEVQEHRATGRLLQCDVAWLDVAMNQSVSMEAINRVQQLLQPRLRRGRRPGHSPGNRAR